MDGRWMRAESMFSLVVGRLCLQGLDLIPTRIEVACFNQLVLELPLQKKNGSSIPPIPLKYDCISLFQHLD